MRAQFAFARAIGALRWQIMRVHSTVVKARSFLSVACHREFICPGRRPRAPFVLYSPPMAWISFVCFPAPFSVWALYCIFGVAASKKVLRPVREQYCIIALLRSASSLSKRAYAAAHCAAGKEKSVQDRFSRHAKPDPHEFGCASSNHVI